MKEVKANFRFYSDNVQKSCPNFFDALSFLFNNVREENRMSSRIELFTGVGKSSFIANFQEIVCFAESQGMFDSNNNILEPGNHKIVSESFIEFCSQKSISRL